MSLLPTLAIVFVTRTMIAEAYRIPSGSMEPTLLVGDWLFEFTLAGVRWHHC